MALKYLCVLKLSELRGEVSRLQAEKEELERELDTQTSHTHQQVGSWALKSVSLHAVLEEESGKRVILFVQVSVLQSQVQASEALLQDLQKSFSQSQNAVQTRLVSDTKAFKTLKEE